MRGFCCVLALCAGFAGASEVGSNVIRLIDKQIHKKVNVLEVKPLKANKDFQIVVVEDPDTQYHIPLLVNKSSDLVIGITNIFFSTSNKDTELVQSIYHQTQSHNFKQQNSESLNAMFDAVPKDYVINLSSSNKGVHKDLYIISDPMCPHCRNELGHIQERLKEANVHMVLVGFLGSESNLKVAVILKEIKRARNTQGKIDILNKVYASAFHSPTDVSDKEVQEVQQVTKSILATKLVKGVPFLYEYRGTPKVQGAKATD
ncbi:DsbA family protein [Helicobacter suis]|uniref:DsbA family protein n=1 Tax=Helicobacter suis TaxID=104628 RepID=UPI001F352F60|nr:disulfide isomerase [Helicobacter suis]